MPFSTEIIGLLQYLGVSADKIAPFLIFGFLLNLSFSKRLGIFSKEINKIANAIVEIQTVLRNNLKVTLQQNINQYGISGSPIVLKSEFRSFITKPKLDQQVDEKIDELIEWLKKQNPKTGIDAQNKISELVISPKINEYLDLTKYKQYLYTKGKTSRDAYGILAVYLFEILIPILFPSGK
ncbi:MAG: hypothetical protein UV74_C0013G0287 [Candidatus Woesebacteria bacterium GW2011_GWB1_43_14]|uniref:Uncharacterized protein n=1 Tax=Candidatus Woesebacteria bacterium GW2011_GWB1_43_14 TaxID=1618578 RepID=A0A0G1DH41_9BACT|nr:MAG: hypothetical protein UT21_C0002G0005 [Candidatus Woesebacteria bacterium GW2011_GWA1_39_11b]KKS78418.1 MAG: hypothetical protein UV51_C0001G0134 [Candidatus Woesebacteria bacterium GW2011_GWC1_42_9]KKS97165.1 MAG: hypothetical protein UV74_C0013G0287 [Candidatus Woesebacteria bacterium GW2011_GWB1_43_14]